MYSSFLPILNNITSTAAAQTISYIIYKDTVSEANIVGTYNFFAISNNTQYNINIQPLIQRFFSLNYSNITINANASTAQQISDAGFYRRFIVVCAQNTSRVNNSFDVIYSNERNVSQGNMQPYGIMNYIPYVVPIGYDEPVIIQSSSMVVAGWYQYDGATGRTITISLSTPSGLTATIVRPVSAANGVYLAGFFPYTQSISSSGENMTMIITLPNGNTLRYYVINSRNLCPMPYLLYRNRLGGLDTITTDNYKIVASNKNTYISISNDNQELRNTWANKRVFNNVMSHNYIVDFHITPNCIDFINEFFTSPEIYLVINNVQESVILSDNNVDAGYNEIGTGKYTVNLEGAYKRNINF